MTKGAAVAVGQIGLEDTIENPICDQMDVGSIKNYWLNATIGI